MWMLISAYKVYGTAEIATKLFPHVYLRYFYPAFLKVKCLAQGDSQNLKKKPTKIQHIKSTRENPLKS